MPSVDDIVTQIIDFLEKRPNADFEEIGAGLGRPPAFIHNICKLRNVELGKPLPNGYDPITDPRRKVPRKQLWGSKEQVQVHEIDYCSELLDFQKWCRNRDFNYKLGLIFSIRLFIETVDKASVWKMFVARLPQHIDELAHAEYQHQYPRSRSPRVRNLADAQAAEIAQTQTDPENADNPGGDNDTEELQP